MLCPNPDNPEKYDTKNFPAVGLMLFGAAAQLEKFAILRKITFFSA